MMIADEIRALLLIHDRLKAWERSFIRDMAKLLEQRRFLTTKQLARGRGIMDRPRVSSVPAQAAPDQLTLLAEPVTHVVEALRPTRPAQPVRPAGEPTAGCTSASEPEGTGPRRRCALP